jgi:hypothetical protein
VEQFPATTHVTVCSPMWGWGPMPIAPASRTGTGPTWSAKHQAPTVRRGRCGSTRRTGSEPTRVTRPGSSDTTDPVAGAGAASAAGVSSVATGPLMALSSTPLPVIRVAS